MHAPEPDTAPELIEDGSATCVPYGPIASGMAAEFADQSQKSSPLSEGSSVSHYISL